MGEDKKHGEDLPENAESMQDNEEEPEESIEERESKTRGIFLEAIKILVAYVLGSFVARHILENKSYERVVCILGFYLVIVIVGAIIGAIRKKGKKGDETDV